jgi:hypothetical protein
VLAASSPLLSQSRLRAGRPAAALEAPLNPPPGGVHIMRLND